MLIRLANISDASAINEIFNQAVEEGLATAETDHVPLDYHKSWLAERDMQPTPIFVAEEQGRVLGYGYLSYYRYGRSSVKHVREISYYVHSEARRKGVATGLVEYAIACCPDISVSELLTFIIAENRPSVGLLQKFGFTLWGTFPGIVRQQGKQYDHAVYGRHLE